MRKRRHIRAKRGAGAGSPRIVAPDAHSGPAGTWEASGSGEARDSIQGAIARKLGSRVTTTKYALAILKRFSADAGA